MKTIDKEKISIIVPVYNVEKYLNDCIKSLINQSYPHLEIILVNDGSSDTSGKICEDWANEDQRIRVIHQENGGLSAARNAGMKAASGNYLAFIDSDDVIGNEMMQRLLEIVWENEADIVECGFIRFWDKIKAPPHSQPEIEIFDTTEALQALMNEQLKQMACNKLFKNEIVEKVEFEKGRLHEDEFWTYQIVAKAKKTVRTDEVFYYYRQQPESIMGQSYRLQRLDALDALETRYLFMKTNFPTLESLAYYRFFLVSLYHYFKLQTHASLDGGGAHRKAVVKRLKKYPYQQYLPRWKAKEKLWFLFFIHLPAVCITVRKSLGLTK